MRARWYLMLPVAASVAVLVFGVLQLQTGRDTAADEEPTGSLQSQPALEPEVEFGHRVLTEEDAGTIRYFVYRAVRSDAFFAVADALDGEPGPSTVLRADALRRANGISQPATLLPGQTILVPLQRGPDDLLLPARSLEAALDLSGTALSVALLQPGLATLAAFEGRLALGEVSLDMSAETGPGYLLTFFRTDRPPFTADGSLDATARRTAPAFSVAAGSLISSLDPAARYLWRDPSTRVLYAVQTGPGSPLGPPDVAELLTTDSGAASP